MIVARTEAPLAEFDPSERGERERAMPVRPAETGRPSQESKPFLAVRREMADPLQSERVSGERMPERVSFDRRELDEILNLYGRMVAAGEWRDYAIDFARERAVFSIFRRAAEVPLYRIEKAPKLARKQGAYSVITATGLILKRGHDLARVIRVLDRTLKVVAG